MSETKPIFCGKCHVPIQGRIDPNGNEEAFCPQCGQSDTLEKLCGKLASFAAHAAAKLLQKKMADAVRGSSVLKITEHHLPERSFRFVVELE